MRFINRFAFALAVAAICAVPIPSHAQGGAGPGCDYIGDPDCGVCTSVFDCAPEPLPSLIAAQSTATVVPALYDVNISTGVLTWRVEVFLSEDPPVCLSGFGQLSGIDRLRAIDFNSEGELLGFVWDFVAGGGMYTPVGSLASIDLANGETRTKCPLPPAAHGYTYTMGIPYQSITVEQIVGVGPGGPVTEESPLDADTPLGLSNVAAGTQVWFNPVIGSPMALPSTFPPSDFSLIPRGLTVANQYSGPVRLLVYTLPGTLVEDPPVYLTRLGTNNAPIEGETFELTTPDGMPPHGRILNAHCDDVMCALAVERRFRDLVTDEYVNEQPAIYTFGTSFTGAALTSVDTLTEVLLTLEGVAPEDVPAPQDIWFESGPWSVVLPQIDLEFTPVLCPEPEPPEPSPFPCVERWFADEMHSLRELVVRHRWADAATVAEGLMEATDGCIFRGHSDLEDGVRGCEFMEKRLLNPDDQLTEVVLVETGPQAWLHGILNRVHPFMYKAGVRSAKVKGTFTKTVAP